ncbi:hypothetical protein NECAME_05798 [Necator americanus]|uniref:Uncharacterized protein n=1 Tax=Necator americanus TaxID=51031 RepID=W2U0E6_NECAM|nr:hypothetical protein NECAME_05798 [Necator americanus]ETN86806.1 hypothetical protein NECAME_05798 [Necator americanus]
MKALRSRGVDTTIRDLMGYTYEHYADWLDYPDYDHTGYPLIYRALVHHNSRKRAVTQINDLENVWNINESELFGYQRSHGL